MKRKALLATAMAALLATGLAAVGPADAANQGQGRGAKMFDRHDINGDGKITKDEFKSGCANKFTMLDADGNGEVTREEAQKAYEQMRSKRGTMGPGGQGGQGGGSGGQGKGPGPKQGQPQ